VIVRNCLTIERLVLSYPDALVLYLQSGLSGDDLMAKLQSQHRDDIEISERMRRLQADFADYCKHIHLFHRVLINYYEPDSLIAQMESILQHELDQRTLNAPSPIANKVFVLMSFSQAQNKVYRAMKAAGRLVDIPGGLRVERIDSRTGDYKITSEILRSIREAALLVCDLSEERPNVYYELGYARGRGKTVLHCAVSDTKLHFDVREFRTIFYDDPLDLQEKLEIEFRNHFLGSLSRDEKSYV
jgi:hypothetical protein